MRETHLFYSQEADGILGLSMDISGSNSNKFTPIYKVMHERGLIDKLMFTLCLGNNGGYFQMGGYDGSNFIESKPSWVPMT